MAKTIMATTQSDTHTGATAAGATEYWFAGNAVSEKNSTLSNREITWRAAGTVSKLYVRVIANTTNANSTVTLMLNGSATALSATITAGTSAEFEDTSDTITVAAGDKLCWRTISGGTGTFTFSIISAIFEATTNSSVRWVSKGYGVATASITHFQAAAGDRAATTGTESASESTVKTAFTAKNFFINVTANARTTNTTFTLRKNRADTAIVFTYGSGATGIQEITATTVSFAVDDEINWEVTTLTGTQTLTFTCLAMDAETTTDNGVLNAGYVGGAAPIGALEPATHYYTIGGTQKEGVTTESQTQMKAREAFTFKNMVIRVAANTVNAVSTFPFRVNGADQITISIPSSGTGFLANTADTYTVAASDLVNFKLVLPEVAGSQTISIQQFSITTELAAAGAAIERALTTETITISDTGTPVARLAAKIRTRTDTAITIGETHARLVGKTRILATQSITLSENIIRIKGKVKSLATETITIGGGTLARLAAKIRTRTETVIITDNRARIKGTIRTLALQTVGIADNVARQVTAGVQQIERALATETVTINESLARLGAKRRALTTEIVTVTGGTVNRVKGAIRILPQTVVIAENIARLVVKTRPLTAQTVTVGAGVIVRIKGVNRLLATQTVTMGAGTIARIKGAIKTIPQTIIVAGGTVVRIRGPVRTILQTITVGTGTLTKQMAKIRSISLQSVILSEELNRVIAGANDVVKTITQTIIVTDNLVKRLVQTRTVTETINITAPVSRVKSARRLLSDSKTVSDSLLKIKGGIKSISQTTIINETLNRLLSQTRAVSQTVTISDNVQRFINIIRQDIEKVLADGIAILEQLTIYVTKRSQRFRRIKDPSVWKLKSNHPAWLLGSRGMHDHYEEFSP